MKIIVTKDYITMSREAGALICGAVKNNPYLTLGLATGSSPIGIYGYLIDAYRNKEISFKDVTTFNLDEYIGLSAGHPQSYRSFMDKELFNHVDIRPENINFPSGTAPDFEKECYKYNKLLNSRPRDIQLLGIGNNGHIGFNEPGTPFESVTHTVELNEDTRIVNARFFKSLDEVPGRAITMGIQDILNAKTIILVATATNKAKAVAAMVKGDITTDCPASVLRTHENVFVIIDEAAASLL